MSVEGIQFVVKRGIGHIILDKIKNMNAQSSDMTLAIRDQLILWKDNELVKKVLIRSGNKRAFCAGADLSYFYQMIKEKRFDQIALFCENEYRLVQQIFHYPKPYESLIDGLVMGGGVGISFHGSLKIATENFRFAMPEVRIGFFPDVAATYFLKSLPHNIGKFLLITGETIGPMDAFHLGLIDYLIPSNQLDDFLYSQNIKNLSYIPDKGPLYDKYFVIDEIFSASTFDHLYEKLSSSNHLFIQGLKKKMDRFSRTSMRIAFNQIHKNETLTFDQLIDQELELARNLVYTSDFIEGITAFFVKRPAEFNEKKYIF